MEWHFVGHYLFDSSILAGVRTTVVLTAISMSVALVLAVVVAVMRLSQNRILQTTAFAWVWFFRGLPLLVLLIVWYNFGLFYPTLDFGVPLGPQLFSVDSRSLVTPMTAAIAAFSLNESAFASEILRASILAIPKGQREAGVALGMTQTRILRRILFPQAFRTAIPPLANDTINMLKNSSLVAFIGVFDLMYSAQAIYQSNFLIVPLLIVVSIWYIIMVTGLSCLQYLLERRSGRQGIWRSRRAARAAAIAGRFQVDSEQARS